MKKIELGPRGYYGAYKNPKLNANVVFANKLIDFYNEKINTFDTYEEQLEFIKNINKQIDELLKIYE